MTQIKSQLESSAFLFLPQLYFVDAFLGYGIRTNAPRLGLKECLKCEV